MKNKKIIIIVVVLAIIALAVYFWLKAKKKKSVVASTSQTVDSAIAAQVNAVKQTQVPVMNTAQAASPATQTPPFSSSQTPAPAPAPTATKLAYIEVERDGSQGRAIIKHQPVLAQFNVGDSVRIPSGPYAGVHKIGYIARLTYRNAPIHNLYLETPFISSGQGNYNLTPGEFYKA